jgi:hypothetical protein
MRELTKSKQIALSAKKADFAPLLADREIAPAFVDALLADIPETRNKKAAASQSITGRHTATVAEAEARKALIIALQDVQAAAAQKYGRTQKTVLRDYLFGSRFDRSRQALEQSSQAVIAKLQSDTLPGITADKKTALVALRQAYIESNETQMDRYTEAHIHRSVADTLLKSITDRRIAIQYAADAVWPYRIKGNRGIRREFFLPSNRPFRV